VNVALVWLAVIAAPAVPAGAQSEFPYDRDLVLDALAMRGGKRVPVLSIEQDGRAQIDLWCRSGPGLVEIAGNAVKFTLGPMREAACTPERAQRDEELAVVLSQMTRWRRENNIVVFVGPTELRFHLSTH